MELKFIDSGMTASASIFPCASDCTSIVAPTKDSLFPTDPKPDVAEEDSFKFNIFSSLSSLLLGAIRADILSCEQPTASIW